MPSRTIRVFEENLCNVPLPGAVPIVFRSRYAIRHSAFVFLFGVSSLTCAFVFMFGVCSLTCTRSWWTCRAHGSCSSRQAWFTICSSWPDRSYGSLWTRCSRLACRTRFSFFSSRSNRPSRAFGARLARFASWSWDTLKTLRS